MCTAATYYSKDHYFGRNLDLEFSYKETVTITPQNYPFKFRNGKCLDNHHAIIGMAYVESGYPLYYDAVNEKGLGMAGLNFPTNAYYHDLQEDKVNIAPFEFIPWILSQCSTIDEVKKLLTETNIANINFSDQLPASPLHWIIADKETSITVESVKEGLKVYDNPVGILTNNPTFDIHMFNLNNYTNLSNEQPVNTFSSKLNFDLYSRGMGTKDLPGGLDSLSRFVKATYTKMNSLSGPSESESISQFFHILGSVDQQRGLVHMGEGKYEITIYSSCCNMDKGIYYYTTYENSQITAVNLHNENIKGKELINYDLIKGQQINYQN